RLGTQRRDERHGNLFAVNNTIPVIRLTEVGQCWGHFHHYGVRFFNPGEAQWVDSPGFALPQGFHTTTVTGRSDALHFHRSFGDTFTKGKSVTLNTTEAEGTTTKQH